MKVKSDIEIAREATKLPIKEVAKKLGIEEEELIPFGHDKAKVSDQFIRSVKNNQNGKLILVTAVNPTPAGEGKTTTTVGLGDGLCALGKRAAICITRGFFGPLLWYERGSCWWRTSASCALWKK